MKKNNKKDGLQAKLENITLDLGTYKVLLHFQNRKEPLAIHFDKPARRFYFSLIALVVNEMKNRDEPEFIHTRKHEKTLKGYVGQDQESLALYPSGFGSGNSL
jgi:hypothetical protein